MKNEIEKLELEIERLKSDSLSVIKVITSFGELLKSFIQENSNQDKKLIDFTTEASNNAFTHSIEYSKIIEKRLEKYINISYLLIFGLAVSVLILYVR